MTIAEQIANRLWQPWLLGLFLLTGLYCSVRSGFFQLFGIRRWWRGSVGSLLSKRKRTTCDGSLTQTQALATALASTIGTGSIAGVATAIFFGGAGAVLWMWVSALLGMMIGFVEKSLAIKHRRYTPSGGWEGGPMCYMERGLGWRLGAKWFSFWCVFAALSGGAMVQSNSIATSLSAAFGFPRLCVGIATALLVGVVVLGGIGRVGRVSEKLVPLMAALFLGAGLIVVLAHRDRLLSVLQEIVAAALTPRSLAGGAAGYGVLSALRYGVARGVFTNEAGVGSSAIAHASADTSDPTEEGFWGMFEVFFATLVVCTVTALAILTSDVYSAEAALTAIAEHAVTAEQTGAPLAGAAFATVLGQNGYTVVSVCLFLFAFTSLLGWSCYGEQGLACLTGEPRLRLPFRLVFLLAVVLGSVGDVTEVWALSDICNGLMAVPNLLAILSLTPKELKPLERKDRR